MKAAACGENNGGRACQLASAWLSAAAAWRLIYYAKIFFRWLMAAATRGNGCAMARPDRNDLARGVLCHRLFYCVTVMSVSANQCEMKANGVNINGCNILLLIINEVLRNDYSVLKYGLLLKLRTVMWLMRRMAILQSLHDITMANLFCIGWPPADKLW
jgi:hypothetical protein